MKETIKVLQDNRLTLLTTLGLNIEGCTTKEELARTIYSWLEEKKERMELFQQNIIALNIHTIYEDGGLGELLEDGWKGFNNFSKEEWIEEVEMMLDSIEDIDGEPHQALIISLTEEATY